MQGRSKIGGVVSVTYSLLEKRSVALCLFGKSLHEDHSLSAIPGRIELNLPIRIYIVIRAL